LAAPAAGGYFHLTDVVKSVLDAGQDRLVSRMSDCLSHDHIPFSVAEQQAHHGKAEAGAHQ
jgi:hypothetical protein